MDGTAIAASAALVMFFESGAMSVPPSDQGAIFHCDTPRQSLSFIMRHDRMDVGCSHPQGSGAPSDYMGVKMENLLTINRHMSYAEVALEFGRTFNCRVRTEIF
jgi:hypothetical protein